MKGFFTGHPVHLNMVDKFDKIFFSRAIEIRKRQSLPNIVDRAQKIFRLYEIKL